MKYMLGALALLGFAAMANAQCYSSYRPSYYSYPTYYKEVTVVKEVPLYVANFVPVVSVGYAASVVSAPAAPLAAAASVQAAAVSPVGTVAAAADPCADLRARFATLEKRVLAMASPQPDPGQPSQLPAPGTAPNPNPRPEQLPTQPPLKAGGPSAAATVILQRCAECHTEGKSPKGGLVLVTADGKLAPLNGDQIKKVLSQTKGQAAKPPKMPKDRPVLNDQEFSSLLDLVD